MYQKTTAQEKINDLSKRIRVIQGGTWASKTISILMWLIDECQHRKVHVSVVSESLPHMKRGALRDFLAIMKEHGYYQEDNYNRSDMIYTFETGAIMEFFGVDSPDKVRGPRRDILFINECNNVSLDVFDQMEVRTREMVLVDYNPVSEFWVHTDVLPTFDCDFLKLTYKDNEAIDERIKQTIEARKGNENWWRIYGLGEVGVLEGQIYDHFVQLDRIPDEAMLVRRGLDFGYTHDPTAIVDVYKWNNAFILDQKTYRTGLHNRSIARIILGMDMPRTLVVADSAEPKSIDEIKHHGVKIIGAEKGQGSVKWGIDLVKAQNIYVTKSSTELIKETRNYLWKTDKAGKSLNEPEDVFNHALDAVRYAISDIVGAGQDKRYNANRIGWSGKVKPSGTTAVK